MEESEHRSLPGESGQSTVELPRNYRGTTGVKYRLCSRHGQALRELHKLTFESIFLSLLQDGQEEIAKLHPYARSTP